MRPEFKPFPKIARLSRDIVITEKLDGTNAQIYIYAGDDGRGDGGGSCLRMIAGFRSRWITPEDDNYGFAKWVERNKEELMKLGEGQHFGEWWGGGIQRGYGLAGSDKRFSLFNTSRWADDAVRPACCGVVPELYRGEFKTNEIEKVLFKLEMNGSVAAPGYMKPEGIIIFHTAGNHLFKKTIDKDEEPKGKSA